MAARRTTESQIARPRGRAVLAALAVAGALVLALSLAGCGLGAGRAPGGVQLLVSRDFGAHVLGSWSAPSVHGEETVMSVLERNTPVATRYGGGFVQSIDGLSGGHERGAPVDWFYYVNGIEASRGAADTNVHSGDHIWWDRHDWGQTDHIPAVVGSFPEPFLNGIGGRRLPVLVQCAAVDGPACRAVFAALRSAGVPAAISALGAGGPKTLSVLVAPWSLIRGAQAARAVNGGPASSGVYATFAADGRMLTLLDENGTRREVLKDSAGLVAATRSGEEAPTWLVTGTDDGGVALAAESFSARTLAGHFAIALTSGGAQALPLISG